MPCASSGLITSNSMGRVDDSESMPMAAAFAQAKADPTLPVGTEVVDETKLP